MGVYKYITNRVLQSTAGKANGNIAVAVRNDSADANVKYTCPECTNKQQTSQAWKRPFSIKCSQCGFLMRLPRLKDEMKKAKKAKKA
ncbi:MAG: hypothetical protein HY518_02040 [Candidatus Aenigmarchaeota archaeon]|nr:hypothetical protein [Candidatus Aenigmarchaeota archaeon]